MGKTRTALRAKLTFVRRTKVSDLWLSLSEPIPYPVGPEGAAGSYKQETPGLLQINRGPRSRTPKLFYLKNNRSPSQGGPEGYRE